MKGRGTNCEAKQISQFKHSIFTPSGRNFANDIHPYACNSSLSLPTVSGCKIKLHVKTIAGAEPQNSLNKDLKGPLLVLFNLFNVPQRKENEEIDSE